MSALGVALSATVCANAQTRSYERSFTELVEIHAVRDGFVVIGRELSRVEEENEAVVIWLDPTSDGAAPDLNLEREPSFAAAAPSGAGSVQVLLVREPPTGETTRDAVLLTFDGAWTAAAAGIDPGRLRVAQAAVRSERGWTIHDLGQINGRILGTLREFDGSDWQPTETLNFPQFMATGTGLGRLSNTDVIYAGVNGVIDAIDFTPRSLGAFRAWSIGGDNRSFDLLCPTPCMDVEPSAQVKRVAARSARVDGSMVGAAVASGENMSISGDAGPFVSPFTGVAAVNRDREVLFQIVFDEGETVGDVDTNGVHVMWMQGGDVHVLPAERNDGSVESAFFTPSNDTDPLNEIALSGPFAALQYANRVEIYDLRCAAAGAADVGLSCPMGFSCAGAGLNSGCRPNPNVPDAGVEDMGRPDASIADGGPTSDGGAPDGGGGADAGLGADSGSGADDDIRVRDELSCTCRIAGGHSPSFPPLTPLVILSVVVCWRRRRLTRIKRAKGVRA
ncbi:MAG: hypothetical protein AAF645_10975 [Myxococcota bacterium]